MLRGASTAAAPPPGVNVDASSYGSGPPSPASGGVGIKRRGKAGSSSAPMELEDTGNYYDGPLPPSPGVGAVAAQIMRSMLQQTALAQQAAHYAVTEAHIAGILHAHHSEAQKRIIPEEIKPVHHNTLQSILKKVRVVQPVTSAPPTVIAQVVNVDLANAEGAARAHARSGGDASTFLGRLIDHTTSAGSAASGVFSKTKWQESLHGLR